MSKLLEMLLKNKITLIVELPENNIELALAAEAAGADALIIKEGEIKGIKIPVGIDLSGQGKLGEKELKKYEKYDFINFHFDSLNSISRKIKTGKIIALSNSYTLDKVIGVENTGAQAIDAAIVPLSQASRDLAVGDLQNYIAIATSSGLPVIIPTQRTIKPSEVAIIADTGAKGLLLTKVVLGDSIKSIDRAVKEYRLAVDDLG